MSALMVTALKQFSRLTLSRCRLPVTDFKSIHSQGPPLAFQASAILWSSPMKKKKKVDPQIVAHREQRKKKKIERQIKRLEKFGRKLKPVDEIAGDMKLRKEMESRKRERTVLSFEESERRALLQKDWTRYKFRQYAEENAAIDRLVYCQQRALEELRKESEELYQQAIQIDDDLIPLEMQGPVSTPPIEDYNSPDGEYKDTTKKY